MLLLLLKKNAKSVSHFVLFVKYVVNSLKQSIKFYKEINSVTVHCTFLNQTTKFSRSCNSFIQTVLN